MTSELCPVLRHAAASETEDETGIIGSKPDLGARTGIDLTDSPGANVFADALSSDGAEDDLPW